MKRSIPSSWYTTVPVILHKDNVDEYITMMCYSNNQPIREHFSPTLVRLSFYTWEIK